MVDRMMERASENPGLINVDTDLTLNKPQLSVAINRDKAADMGVGVATLGRTLETMLGGRQVTRFKQRRRAVRRDRPGRATPTAPRRTTCARSTCAARAARWRQLSNLVQRDRDGRAAGARAFQPAALGDDRGEPRARLLRSARRSPTSSSWRSRSCRPTARTDYSGLSREFKQASAGLYFTFVLALGFIFLVLAAQFESFRSPLIIMLTVPLSITGGLLAL